MASEINLKYLHPSIHTYITTENYNYDTSVSREVLFVADVFEHGKDNELQQVNTVSEYLFKYGSPNIKKFGQAGYNVEKWLTNGNSAVIMRLLPEDACYAHAVFNIQYKNSTNGKTVIDVKGEETKINDIYLRPLVTYIGINNTSEKLIDSELSEDRSNYPTTDGYIDNFIFAVYPEGRGEYYNDLGFRIRLNPSYDGTLTSRVYTFEVIRYTGTAYDIVDGPYYVTFDPDAIDPNSQKSMFIENVINSYSEYVKVKFNTENYIKLATIINNEVDPYVIDVISGQSRILNSGETETYFSELTGKNEDVHIALKKYSSNGIEITNNGQSVLNILNNDETSADIVDIADNGRKVIYMNQKFVTDYMRTFYNWLIQENIKNNLNKIIENPESAIESNNINGLLYDKVNNLIFANNTNDQEYSYQTGPNNSIISSKYVGASGREDAWYARALEVINPNLKNDKGEYVGTKDTTGYENVDEVYISTQQMINTINEDGYISKTNEHLISYYNNFMKYMQFVINYDVYNNKGFVLSDEWIEATNNFKLIKNSVETKFYSLTNLNNNKNYIKLLNYDKSENSSTTDLMNSNFKFNDSTNRKSYKSIFDYVLKNIEYKFDDKIDGIIEESDYPDEFINDTEGPGLGNNKDFINIIKSGIYGGIPCCLQRALDSTGGSSNTLGPTRWSLVPVYIDITTNDINYIPIIDVTTYNSDGTINPLGDYLKIMDLNGDYHLQPYRSISLMNVCIPVCKKGDIKRYVLADKESVYKRIINLFNQYLFPIEESDILNPDSILTAKVGFTYKIFNIKQENKENNTSKEFSMKVVNYTFSEFVDTLTEVIEDINSTKDFIKNCVLIINRNKTGNSLNDILTYKDYLKNKNIYNQTKDVIEISLISLIKFINTLFRPYINETRLNTFKITSLSEDQSALITGSAGKEPVFFRVPGTKRVLDGMVVPISTFNLSYKNINNDDIVLTNKLNNVLGKIYFKPTNTFDNIFSESIKNNKLSQSYNKALGYATLISKELDGIGKDSIDSDLTTKNIATLDYSDYSLTTIFNFLIGGFESIVNNQGSITDYSNYSSLKYLIRTINNNLDLRSTYLILLNVHRNNISELSTSLAKQNASVILGDETLNNLYSAMDSIVSEANYLRTNVINSILNQTYTIKDLDKLIKVSDNKPYAYYFNDKEEFKVAKNIDPLGILCNMNNYGKVDDTTEYHGILPLLEKIIINITGENSSGEYRKTLYGGPSLVSLYDDIKNGYLAGGLTQERYETIYKVLSESLAHLLDIHQVITAFVNEKYISEIINILIGTIDINNTIIVYNGSTYSVNGLWELYNSGTDENLTQEQVINLINESIDKSSNKNPLPIEFNSSYPVIQYPAFCMSDIINSISIAEENKDIVKNNINKQDGVLASLNSLCYDNLVTDVGAPISLTMGSDGSFEYDDSSQQALKIRLSKINDARIKAYKGTWNDDVINTNLFEFDFILDANYEDPIKNAIITLARDIRKDFFYFADTKIQNTIKDCLDWKDGFTNTTYFMSIIGQSQNWYDEYTSRNVTLTSTYLISDILSRHLNSYGRHMPMAGSRRGIVGGFISNDWYPNEEQKEKLYVNKINYLEKEINHIRIGAQNTNYPNGPLGKINNVLTMLKIKRTVEKIAKRYQFEFNTVETRNMLATEINDYLTTWVNNGACVVATATVYASDYDILQQITRVDITLQFTGVIERIVINIDCPAR